MALENVQIDELLNRVEELRRRAVGHVAFTVEAGGTPGDEEYTVTLQFYNLIGEPLPTPFAFDFWLSGDGGALPYDGTYEATVAQAGVLLNVASPGGSGDELGIIAGDDGSANGWLWRYAASAGYDATHSFVLTVTAPTETGDFWPMVEIQGRVFPCRSDQYLSFT